MLAGYGGQHRALGRRHREREPDPREDQRRNQFPVGHARLRRECDPGERGGVQSETAEDERSLPVRLISRPVKTGGTKVTAPHGISRRPAESGP